MKRLTLALSLAMCGLSFALLGDLSSRDTRLPMSPSNKMLDKQVRLTDNLP